MPENVVHHRTRSRTRDAIRLPLVIRPTPLRLGDIERRARTEIAFARALQERSGFCGTLAHALMLRDAEARRRFGDEAALAEHLRSLRAG